MSTIYNRPTTMDTNFPVDAFDADRNFIGEYNSIHAAAKDLHLCNQCIWRYLFIKTPKVRKTGVGSRKHKNKYHFKLK
jgi:hypothetical protein